MRAEQSSAAGERAAIRVVAARNLAYAPHYVARALGMFEDAGVRVDLLEQAPGHGSIADAVIEGRADLVLGSAVFADRLNRAEPSVIAAVSNQQTRHFLYRRATDPAGPEDDDFDWSGLRGATVIVAPTFVPTSWVAFREILHRRGILLDDVKALVGYQPDAVVDEFLDGPGDYLLAGGQEGQDERLREAVPLASALGPVPWSVYCATRAWAAVHADELDAFRAGLGRAQAWLALTPAERVVDVLAPVFSDVPVGALLGTVEQFQRIRFWAESPQPRADELEAWRDALVRAGLLLPDTRVRSMIEEAGGEASAAGSASDGSSRDGGADERDGGAA